MMHGLEVDILKIGYARVSSADQNLDMQLRALEAYGCDTIFTDQGVSGGTKPQERFGFRSLSRSIKKHSKNNEKTVLVVWKLDRLGRSLKTLIDTLDTFHDQNIGFVSVTESIDTSSATGRAFMQFVGLMAELERGLIRERTLEGLRAAKSRGVILGRPKKLSRQAEAQIQSEILEHGKSHEEVSVAFGVSISTTRRVIRKAITLNEDSTSRIK